MRAEASYLSSLLVVWRGLSFEGFEPWSRTSNNQSQVPHKMETGGLLVE